MKEVIITIIVVALILSGIVFGLVKLNKWLDVGVEKGRQQQKEKFFECLEWTDKSVGWCYDNFIK